MMKTELESLIQVNILELYPNTNLKLTFSKYFKVYVEKTVGRTTYHEYVADTLSYPDKNPRGKAYVVMRPEAVSADPESTSTIKAKTIVMGDILKCEISIFPDQSGPHHFAKFTVFCGCGLIKGNVVIYVCLMDVNVTVGILTEMIMHEWEDGTKTLVGILTLDELYGKEYNLFTPSKNDALYYTLSKNGFSDFESFIGDHEEYFKKYKEVKYRQCFLQVLKLLRFQ